MIIAKSIFILLTLLVVVEKNEAALYSDSLEYAQLSTYSALNEKI